MDEPLNWLRWLFVGIGAAVTALLGGWDIMLKVLALFVVFDYLTGIAAAWCQKSLNSKIGARGIVKKVLIFCVVTVSAQVDVLLGSAFADLPGLPDIPAICRSLTIWFYIANEGLSILENASEAGVPLPHSLIDALVNISNKSREAEQETTVREYRP